MQCKNCSEVVAPKFTHALKTNICPFCGEAIMSDELQIALSELQEVMLATDKYKVELFDWLRANYNLIDVQGDEYKALQEKAEMAHKMPIKQNKTADPKNVVLDKQGNQIGETLQDQSVTDKFMQRANAKVNQQDRYRDIINQIKKGGASSEVSMGGGGSGGMGSMEEADPEEVMAMEGALSGGAPIINSGLMSSDFNDDSDIPAVVEAMVQQAGGSTSADYNAKDVAKLNRVQGKASRVKKAMANGGSIGLIRR